MKKFRRPLVVSAAALVGVGVLVGTEQALAATAPTLAHTTAKPTIVLVHGAFADASSWSGVIQNLQHDGYTVIAPANPLRGLPSDSAYLASILHSIKGPIVLVGHSYGGEVISDAAVGDLQVKALVYIAAIAPAKGESANDILGKFPGSELGGNLNQVSYPLPGGKTGTDLYIKPDKFRAAFAADVPAATATVMAITQRPVDASSLGAPSTAPAWRNIPSWYLVADQDKTIPPAAERFMAKRAHAHTSEVNSSHAVTVSHPGAVTKIIVDAIHATTH